MSPTDVVIDDTAGTARMLPTIDKVAFVSFCKTMEWLERFFANYFFRAQVSIEERLATLFGTCTVLREELDASKRREASSQAEI